MQFGDWVVLKSGQVEMAEKDGRIQDQQCNFKPLHQRVGLASMDSALRAENSALLILTFGLPKPTPSQTVYPGLSPGL